MNWLKVNHLFANRYKLIRRLGSGGFAEVWLAEDTLVGSAQIAIKIFTPDKGLDDQGVEIFKNEYELTANLVHAHLLKAIYFDVNEKFPYLILPYCELGSLDRIIRKRQEIDETLVVRVLTQISGALAYLHENQIVHQDIKPDNILILEPDRYMLADFGISSKMRRILIKSLHTQQIQSNKAFTPGYASPEWRTSKPLPKGDIFSLGITIYELASGYLPFPDPAMALEGGAGLPELPPSYSKVLYRILALCTSVSPENRPNAQELHHWGKSYLTDSFWKKEKLPPHLFGERDSSSDKHSSIGIRRSTSQKIRISSRGITSSLTEPVSQEENKKSIQITGSRSHVPFEEPEPQIEGSKEIVPSTEPIPAKPPVISKPDSNTYKKSDRKSLNLFIAMVVLLLSIILVFLYLNGYV